MNDLLEQYSNYALDLSILIWPIIGIIVVIIVTIILKIVIKNHNQKKERERTKKDFEEVLSKYSDVIADKVVNKLKDNQ